MRPPVPRSNFSLAEAPTEAESTSITVRGIQAIVNGDHASGQIQANLPQLVTEITARLEESESLLASNPSLQLLGSQEQDWHGIEINLVEWDRLLAERLATLRRQGDLLVGKDDKSGLRAIWLEEQELLNYWLQYGSRQDLPERAREPISKTLDLIDAAEEEQKAANTNTLALRADVNHELARVREVLFTVRQARDGAFNRLLVRNSPVIWNVPMSSKGLVQQGQDSFGRQIQAVMAYINQRRENVGVQVVILFLLIGLLYFIRHRINRWTEKDPALAQATKVFCSPIATAVALTILLSIWIYPQAPRLFWAAIGAAALLPTVIILRSLIGRRLFPILNALVVFYFLDQVRSIAAVVPLAARALLLIESFGAVFLLMSFIRSSRLQDNDSRVWNIIRFFSWLWIIVFVLAFLGDIVGFVSLSSLMGDAALGSAYLAVILYACMLIISGFLVISFRSRPLSLLRMVREHQGLLLFRTSAFLHWATVAIWILGVLASLSVATAARDLLRTILSAQVSYGELHLSLGHVLAFIFAIWFSVQLSRFLRFVLEEDVYDRFSLPGGIPYAISKMLNYLVLLMGFFIAVSLLGYDMTKFTILAGAFGVGLGFGMQNIVNNFVSGLILLFERPVKVGDVIQMGDTTGVVSHIGIRASIIHTANSSEIIVPNGNLISSQVTNWTLSNRQRGIDMSMNLAANVEPSKVINILLSVAAKHPRITKSPAPQAFLTKFTADAFSYELHAWTDTAEQWIQIRSELSIALYDELAKQQVAIK